MADWTDVLKTLAPTVATAVIGPLGGVAVAALGKIFGISEATQKSIGDVITNAQMTAEQVEKIKELELQYQNEEKERGFKYAQLVYEDRNSARKRESDTKDNTNRILAYSIVAAFIAMVTGTLVGWAKVDSVLAGTLVGYLSAKTEQVLAYYFGSSIGSNKKTDLLAKAQPINVED